MLTLYILILCCSIQCLYFEGQILNVKYDSNDKPFGIFEVDIESPSDIRYPLLQTKIKTDKGYRTISPIGN